MKKLNLYLSWLCLGVFISLCGCKSSPPVNPKDRPFRINIAEDPPTLDPREVSDSASGFVMRFLFEGLMRYSSQGELEPAVAETIHVSEDGKTYTFKLKQTFWSNGDLVTAYDFEKSWKEIISPKNGSAGANNLFSFKNAQLINEGKLPLESLGVKAIDPLTLVVQLEQIDPYFLEFLTTHYTYPIPSQYITTHPQWPGSQEKDFVSNGPFTLKKWQFQYEIALEKNPLYWDASSVKLNEIKCFMVDEQTELSLFEAGDLDWAGSPISGIFLEVIPTLKKQGRLHTKPTRSLSMFIFNTRRVPFNSSKIRKAFSYALNRQEMATHLFHDGLLPALAILRPEQHDTTKMLFNDHDIEKARELFNEGLQELGITKEQLPPLVLSYNTNETFYKVALTAQNQWWDAFGIRILLESNKWKTHIDRIDSGDFMIARMGYIALTQEPFASLGRYARNETAFNPSGWSFEPFNELIEQSKTTVNKEAYLALAQQAEALLLEEMPIAPLFFKKNVYLKDPLFRNEVYNSTGYVDFRYAYFADEAETS